MDWEAFGKHFNDNIQPVIVRDAAEQVRRGALPQNAQDLKFELPKDFQAPNGPDGKPIQFSFRENDPLLDQARTLMHDISHGKVNGQEAFSKLLGLYAGAQVGETQRYVDARTAEINKLGATGPSRVTAVNTWLDAMGAGELKDRMWTAADVQAFERLITRHTSQGASNFSQAHRDTPTPQGRVSEAEYNAMTPAQRWEYAKSFDQGQFKTNGAGR